MAVHDRVLEAARRICRERGGWTFRPAEVVAALAGLNTGSVRTHVMSRCCVNAPPHHPHRWPYFRRVRRGVYEVLPAWRRSEPRLSVAERAGEASADSGPCVQVRESAGRWVAELPGRGGRIRALTLDEIVGRVRCAGSVPVRLQVELGVEDSDPVISAYEKDVDPTLVRQSLRMGFEERLRALQRWMEAVDEVRGAVGRAEREQDR